MRLNPVRHIAMQTGLSNCTTEQFEAHKKWLLEKHQAAAKGRPTVETFHRPKGPGDYLHDAIIKWVGEAPTQKCGCKDKINKMNAWGPNGCREHLDEIVDWLAAEAKNRGWWRFAVAVPGSRFFLKRMVLIAIKKTERG